MRRRLAGLSLALLLCFLIALAATVTLRPNRGLSDFGVFVTAGIAYNQGLNPYESTLELAAASGLNVDGKNRISPNLNPPISLYAWSLVAKVDPFVARNALNVVSALLYLGACILLLRAYPWQRRAVIVLWLAALAGFWYTLLLGQIYILVFAMGLGAWLLIERKGSLLLAGLLIGMVIAIKPNFAVWPLLLLVAGHGRPAMAAMLSAAVVSAAPLLLEGPGIYGQWLHAARDYPNTYYATNAAVFGTADRLGVPVLGYLLAGGVIAGAAFWARRLRLSVREASAWGMLLPLIVGPLTWVGYLLFTLPLLMSRRWGGWEAAIAAILIIPSGLGDPVGEIRLAGLLLLAGLIASDALRARRTQPEPMEYALPVEALRAA